MPVPAELNACAWPPHLFARDRHVDVFEPDARLDESLDAQVFYRSSSSIENYLTS